MVEQDLFSEKWQSLLYSSDALLETAQLVLSGSGYVAQWGERHADRAGELIMSEDINVVYDAKSYQQRLSITLENSVDETVL